MTTTRMWILGLLGVCLGLAACGGGGDLGPTVSERCTEAAQTLCDRLYECFTPAQRQLAGLPDTEAGCVTRVEAEAGCARASETTFCEGNEKYHPAEHERCIEQMSTASCGQITADAEDFAPACARVCSVE